MIIKGFSFLLFLYESICCGYSLESPHRGDYNDHPQRVFMEKCRKLSLNYPQIPSLSGLLMSSEALNL